MEQGGVGGVRRDQLEGLVVELERGIVVSLREAAVAVGLELGQGFVGLRKLWTGDRHHPQGEEVPQVGPSGPATRSTPQPQAMLARLRLWGASHRAGLPLEGAGRLGQCMQRVWGPANVIICSSPRRSPQWQPLPWALCSLRAANPLCLRGRLLCAKKKDADGDRIRMRTAVVTMRDGRGCNGHDHLGWVGWKGRQSWSRSTALNAIAGPLRIDSAPQAAVRWAAQHP